jgi:hypothetical protein
VRKDLYNYYPSNNPLADLGPPNLQAHRSARPHPDQHGAHSDFTYAKGIQEHQGGAVYQQTFLRENDRLGVVDATYNAPCVDAGNPVAGY